jgi:hypothetical protein
VILGIVDRLVNSKNVHPELILSTGTVTKQEEIVQEEDCATTVVELATVSLASMVLVVSIRLH